MNELITSKANLHKSHQMLRGDHARKFDFFSLALFQNWYSFLLCNDLWILLLGLTNKTCSLQVFRVTSKANLPKSHQMLRGHACKFDFSSLALSQNWCSFLLCSDLWIRLLGLTNKTCSLQVFRVALTEIKASDELRKIEYSCFLAVIYMFWNSFQTSEATTTRFFTAHQNVSGKHCQIAFYCRVTNKSSQTNHSCLRAERVYSVHKRQTRMTRNNPWTMDYRPKLFLLTHRKFVFN